MACQHRFYNDLISDKKNVEFLFIGTFNPSWDAINNNNAEYFYGRGSSLFWCICPHAFNDICLIDKDKNDWIEFAAKYKIEFSDIVSAVSNANIENENHYKLLTNFEDNNLDLKVNKTYYFDLEFNTENIKQFISINQKSLKGVFFTRKSKGSIQRIWNNWKEIEKHCNQLSINNSALLTPSTKGGTIRNKIETWRFEIQKTAGNSRHA